MAGNKTAAAEDYQGEYERLYFDRRYYIEGCLWIKTKDERLIPLKLNEPQDKLFQVVEAQERAGRPVRVVCLKARQEGISTGIQGIFFHKGATHPFCNGLTVAHDLDSSDELFAISRLYYDRLDPVIRPSVHFSNRKELVFENPDNTARLDNPGLRSQLRVGTAGDDLVGRSKTIHLLHCSELAFWKNAERTLLSLRNAVPDNPGTMIFLESTGNGVGGAFHAEYQKAKRGETDYQPFFLPWFDLKEYSRPLAAGAAQGFAESLDDEERGLRAKHGLTLGQLNWRRWAIPNKCNGDISLFRQEYPADDVECFLVSGRARFDGNLLRGLLADCFEPLRGYLRQEESRVRLEENGKGYVRMWKPPMPGRKYVIGADVAEGLIHGDFSCAHVYDRQTLELVCEWHGHIEPDLFGDELAKLGRIYNQALIGVEANNHGYTTLARLKREGYPRLFYRQDTDSRTKRPVQKLGWRTDTRTKPQMVDDLAGALRDGLKLWSKQTVEELMTYVVSDDGETNAQEGCFDDRVVASAVAVQMHKRMGLSRIFPSLG